MVAGTHGSLDKEGATKMTQTTTPTAGIDIAKNTLDVGIHGQSGTRTLDNAVAGWTALVEQLRSAGVQKVGMEATGGYERGVMRHLQEHGFTVVLLQPLQVKAFAKLQLQRAKSDRIDAGLIAACTFMFEARAQRAEDARFDALGDLLTFIEQAEEDIVCCKTRMEHITDKRLLRIVAANIKRLEKQRADEMQRLAAALGQHEDLAQRVKLVLSIPGIGERTAISIVVRMPELGGVSREEAASLAGLAPFVHQSGKRKGETHIGGGRKRLRRALYAAAMPAAHFWNPGCKALYARLIARGKPHVSAMVACARKLLIYANTVVARGTPWTKELAAKA
jgi:transposase